VIVSDFGLLLSSTMCYHGRMASDDRTRSAQPTLWRIWYWIDRSAILIPLVFLVLMVWLAPISFPAEFDTDEGVNLMKAMLVSRGHGLYAEVWSDQPPVLTWLLAATFRAFGASVTAGRALVLFFSALLLWAFYQAVRLSASRTAAWLGVLLLVFSAWYLRLSIAVMVGLPALALAMLSTYFFLLSRSGSRTVFLMASGMTLALAMQTKLLAGMLAPVMLTYALLVGDGEGRQPSKLRWRLRSDILWSASLFVSFAVMGLLFRSLNLSQLVQPHLGYATRSAFPGSNLSAVRDLLLREIGLLPFALVGTIWALRERRRIVWLPLGWFLVALAFLIYEKPLWYHHATVLTVPLAWLAALGADAWIGALRRLTSRWKVSAGFRSQGAAGALRLTCIGLVGVVCLYLAFFGSFTVRPRFVDELRRLTPAYNAEVAAFVREGYAGEPGWVFSDRPIYAFRAGLPVPPPIAALTVKRMRSTGVSDQEMAAVLQSYHPEIVVLERFRPDYGPVFRSALASRYEPISTSQTTEVWAPGLPPALQDRGDGAGFHQHEFDGWLTLAMPEAALPEGVRAGEELRVSDLWWLRAEDRPGRPLAVSLRLVDQVGQVWSQRDTRLGTELVDLRNRSHVRQSLAVPVPEELPAGDYRVEVVVYDPQTVRPLTASATSDDAGNAVVLGSVRVDKSPKDGLHSAGALTSRRALADFGSARLLRAQTAATAVSPGDSVPVSLVWQAGRNLAGDSLVVVVQLLGDHDRVVASLEEEPLQGRYPTSQWQPGELVADSHGLTVLRSTQPGRYRLVIGLYRASDRERLNAGGGFFGLLPQQYFTAGFVDVR
jgi:4-amino-4-deoxy-L-arabinose transferase-like glycosyltransferase